MGYATPHIDMLFIWTHSRLDAVQLKITHIYKYFSLHILKYCKRNNSPAPPPHATAQIFHAVIVYINSIKIFSLLFAYTSRFAYACGHVKYIYTRQRKKNAHAKCLIRISWPPRCRRRCAAHHRVRAYCKIRIQMQI